MCGPRKNPAASAAGFLIKALPKKKTPFIRSGVLDKDPGDDLLRVVLRAKKNPASYEAGFWIKTLAMTYSCMA